MSAAGAVAPTLFELLARSWQLGTPILEASFSGNNATVLFVGADGKAWLAPATDTDSPIKRFRVAADTGRATISPRRKAPPALRPIVLDDEVSGIARFGAGFAAGCRSGRLLTIESNGRIGLLTKEDAPIDALDAIGKGPDLVVACAGVIKRFRHDRNPVEVIARSNERVAGLAARWDGRSIAWADAEGLHVASDKGEASSRKVEVHDAAFLAWSPDARWLASSFCAKGVELFRIDNDRFLGSIAIPEYPALVNDLVWSPDSRTLATSGAFRIIAWDVGSLAEDSFDRPAATKTGGPRPISVTAVALNLRRPMIAAGYEDGVIAVAQIGRTDELIVREAGKGPLATMCWSDDGDHLAFGGRDGEAAIVTFPPSFFK